MKKFLILIALALPAQADFDAYKFCSHMGAFAEVGMKVRQTGEHTLPNWIEYARETLRDKGAPENEVEYVMRINYRAWGYPRYLSPAQQWGVMQRYQQTIYHECLEEFGE